MTAINKSVDKVVIIYLMHELLNLNQVMTIKNSDYNNLKIEKVSSIPTRRDLIEDLSR
ncbi:MAG: hypothetical protein ACFFB2_14730 [Promethearchaeota archaeon]